ncbi:eukaryotic translation initiation factor 2C, 3 [Phlyctochytrium bullatum]|nr:eukaryotic translation initiation factor 2C, 3 [Phlyctochytrium bullatum]
MPLAPGPNGYHASGFPDPFLPRAAWRGKRKDHCRLLGCMDPTPASCENPLTPSNPWEKKGCIPPPLVTKAPHPFDSVRNERITADFLVATKADDIRHQAAALPAAKAATAVVKTVVATSAEAAIGAAGMTAGRALTLRLRGDVVNVAEARAQAAAETNIAEVIAGSGQLDIRPPSVAPRPPPMEPLSMIGGVDATGLLQIEDGLLSKEHAKPRRPGKGENALKRMELYTNYYKLQFPTTQSVFHYDVTISPDPPPAKETPGAGGAPPAKNRLIFDILKETPGMQAQLRDVVYDGRKNIYSLHKLTAVERLVTLDDGGRSQDFKVRIRPTEIGFEIKMSGLQSFLDGVAAEQANPFETEQLRDQLHVLDVVFKTTALTCDLYPVIRSTGGVFFDKTPQRNVDLGGLNAHTGWKQSIRPTYRQLFLNMDTAVTTFYPEGSLIDVVARYAGKRGIRDVNPGYFDAGSPSFRSLDRYLRTVKVRVNHRRSGRQKYAIQRLDPQGRGAKDIQIDFDGEGGVERMSVFDYFRDKLQRTIQYPQLPLVDCGKGAHKVYFPMEFLTVMPGQRHVGKLTETQTGEIIKIAAAKPEVRRSGINTGRRTLHRSEEATEIYDRWNISIGETMEVVSGRVLPAPSMRVTDAPPFRPQHGTFELYREKAKFFSSAPRLEAFAILVTRDIRIHPEQIVAFFRSLFGECQNRGLQIAGRDLQHLIVRQENISIQQALMDARELALRGTGLNKAQMIFCIIPKKGALEYDIIKAEAETRLDVMTQCVSLQSVNKKSSGIVNNMALKINAKLGGINYHADVGNESPSVRTLRSLGGETMMLGIDVVHPGPGMQAAGSKSIAAVVASVDERTIIGGLGELVAPLLDQFIARHPSHTMPRRIIVYRGGVSEGEFAEVAFQELQSLKRMLREKNCRATVTLLIVNKRHSTRFFCKNAGDADRSKNVPAGTVVDTDIIHPFEFDFFLNSHPGLQGTSRSAHYHVIYDENKMTADEIQQLTYSICYNYSKATRAVSIPPPIYHAHNVASRVRCYRVGGGPTDTQSMASGGSGPVEEERFGDVVGGIKDSMFFS